MSTFFVTNHPTDLGTYSNLQGLPLTMENLTEAIDRLRASMLQPICAAPTHFIVSPWFAKRVEAERKRTARRRELGYRYRGANGRLYRTAYGARMSTFNAFAAFAST